ncbi:aminotransferase class IV [Haloplanus aerogenes]|uniref:Aminodeoxychorismate lyase n=1 Tax=Haloplanus aerogenes TaxID=660522 RepID=A0A3M0CWS3_9EURY|nr:aminotransferase class IV [Haloplanus aerogenes]AZH25096.1 aminodeoxychorismate lyase [Haloplanus aerogenes]RMB13682.1 branched-chain amino acid aminotransferase [Haloplanus aerogenes]
MQYYVDGSLVDAEAAALPVDDRGLSFGDAVREPLRAVDGTPVAWQAHVDRLLDACDALGFDPGVDAAELRDRVAETLAANDPDDALVHLSITRGREQRTASSSLLDRARPPTDPDPTVVVTVDPLSSERTPVALQTVRTRPIGPVAVPAAPVTHNRLDAVRAQAELRQAAPPDDDPADEALLLADEAHVVGGTASDPVFVADDALRLPALDDWPARTATRAVVRDLARAEGFPVVEGDYTPADFRAADEAFVAEPTAGVRPVARLDGVAVGGGPLTRLLAHLYDERVVGDD